jgi:hypothetical protein
MWFGPLIAAYHEYLCVRTPSGSKCTGHNPSGDMLGSPGQNNPSDGFVEGREGRRECHQISDNPCFVGCISRKFVEYEKKPFLLRTQWS